MMRTLRVPLGRKVDDWPRSRAMALATRCARDVLARTGEHLACEPEWTFEPTNGDTGPLTMAVATVAIDTRADVVRRAQALMAAMDHVPRCSSCEEWAQMNLYRFERGLTITEACASLGLNSRAYYRHSLVHPNLNAGVR
jgi:hypothetical protein